MTEELLYDTIKQKMTEKYSADQLRRWGKKPLEELTLMDDYMFGVVMRDRENLKPLLEGILNVIIQEIDFVEAQSTEKPGYLSRGIRMDLYVKDEHQSVYNVEVQTSSAKNLPRRMRYYQSVIDSTVLAPGVDYHSLQTSYVIFICNYDLFKEGRYIYWFDNRCQEKPDMVLNDGAEKIIVNTRGYCGMITEKLREIITYLNLGIATGDYTRRLEESVARVKCSEERKVEYMVMAIREMEIRAEAREAGYEEGREEGRGLGLDRGIRGAVELLRDDGKSDSMIITKIMQKYDLTEEKAAAYVFR